MTTTSSLAHRPTSASLTLPPPPPHLIPPPVLPPPPTPSPRPSFCCPDPPAPTTTPDSAGTSLPRVARAPALQNKWVGSTYQPELETARGRMRRGEARHAAYLGPLDPAESPSSLQRAAPPRERARAVRRAVAAGRARALDVAPARSRRDEASVDNTVCGGGWWWWVCV